MKFPREKDYFLNIFPFLSERKKERESRGRGAAGERERERGREGGRERVYQSGFKRSTEPEAGLHPNNPGIMT